MLFMVHMYISVLLFYFVDKLVTQTISSLLTSEKSFELLILVCIGQGIHEFLIFLY